MHDTDPAEIIIGIDTHKEAHAAVAINGLGSRLGAMTLPASRRGYQELEAWAHSLGRVRSFGIEGTGSYGAGLSRFLQERGHNVIEVNRPNRQIRHQHGKTDPLDAENAARAVLSGQARAAPKSGTSSVEMIRHLKVARDTAVKSRTQARSPSRQSSSTLQLPCVKALRGLPAPWRSSGIWQPYGQEGSHTRQPPPKRPYAL
jgi:transposase